MANKNKIGCSAGRAKIVDPNDFDGFSADSNVPVQLEDLNISVVLTSFRKGRTLLTGEKEGGIKEDVSEIRVNFLEGSKLGGDKKVLTTSYTDLTTRFESDITNDETLGINSIDIEFNASMAPLITINFTDVRGSSIFQNEENILNNRGNKYTTFFQLPYPMFELEIKGYYGFPVKYCLHMLKFNSKFNSQTGNFEITANFIGYTFALMADMLLGYLKAIPFTTIGKEQFKKYNDTFTNGNTVLGLSDLVIAINRINDGVEKEINENPAAKELNAVDEATEILDLIKNQINILGQGFPDLNTGKEEYQYIVFNHVTTYNATQKNALDNLYKVKVKELIDKYNTLNPDDKLSESDFVNIETSTSTTGGKLYKNVTLEELKSTADNPSLNLKLGNPSNAIQIKEKIVKHINSNNATPAIGDKAALDIFDMTLLFEKLGVSRKALEVSGKDAKKQLAKAFESEVRSILGFDPTARTIIECYTAAIEVFVETIFLVSEAASKSTGRKEELAKKFKDDDEAKRITDMSNVYIRKEEFFPWPDYREKDAEKNAYVDKYLGAADVLDQPERVDELRFIDDLLKAFREAAKREKDALEAQEKIETTWNPVNPFDSFIFTDLEPYERAGTLTTLPDVVRLMVIRAMIFLGYSTDPTLLTDEEIIAMGKVEVDNMLRGVKDAVLRQSLTQLDVKYFKGVSGKINTIDRTVVKEESGEVYYNYIYTFTGKDGWKLIPISDGFNNETKWGVASLGDTPEDNAKNIVLKNSLAKLRNDTKAIFLTNYSNTPTAYKLDDGGSDIKILTSLPTSRSLGTTPEGVPTETIMDLALLKEDTVTAEAGYNSFNPNFGTQEFKELNWGNEKLNGLPLMYMFYRNCDIGLGFTRQATKIDKGLQYDTVSPYFYKDGSGFKPTITMPDDKRDVYRTGGDQGTVDVHSKIGLNRELFQGMINGGSGGSITYPYIELRYNTKSWDTDDEPRLAYTNGSFSLFGSRLYYEQSYAEIVQSDNTKISCEDYSKAFLFLQTLPFNVNQHNGDPLDVNEIKHLFDMKAGIIHAPRLWCAYIGGILWRFDTNNPEMDGTKITGGGSGKKDPIVWSKDYSSGAINSSDVIWDNPVIKKSGEDDQFFPTVLSKDGSLGNTDLENYEVDKGSPIKTLPQQVKKEFKRIFFEFVNGDAGKVSWESLAGMLEIFDTKDKTAGYKFTQYINAIYAKSSIFSKEIKVSTNDIIKGTIAGIGSPFETNYDNITTHYDIIAPINEINNKFYLHLQLRDGSEAVTSIIDAMMEEVIIVNSNYKIWKKWDGGSTEERAAVTTTSAAFDLYFSAVTETLKGKADEYNISKQNENIDISLFGTANKDIIRLQLYRNCKNIYDKWLGGAEDVDHLVFQCGGRNSVDHALAKKYSNSKVRMIDSFRFVTRNFRDIGNELYINPIPINNRLIGNPNSSAYDAISDILASNNFNFQALPNFINFHDDTILEAIFKPYNYENDLLVSGSCGPAFVCVYDGQSSKHLELKDGNYPNDGFDLRCMNGGVDVSVPTDFTSEKYEAWEEPVSTFMVRYSQQNQNIFKDINLDQSEFSETDESIQIQDEISQKGSENNRAIVGQNIYNVYAVRSYTAQVEMMGNAMIQPMMYFQLDNIPMFHGAYLITKVSHSIKPNSMSTNFSGTRIRYPETPLITAYDVYMDLIETLDLSEAGTGEIGGGGSTPASSPPILQTLIDNGCSGSNIDAGNIKPCKVPKMPGIEFMLNPNTQMICEAVEPLKEMMKDWVDWMKSQNLKAAGQNGSYAYITSMFRTNGGSSMHCFGLALDFQFFDKDGNIFRNQEENVDNVKNAFNFTKNPSLKWLYNHAYEYGFVQPYWANDGNKVGTSDGEEWWHWEYHGKAAIYQLRNRPIPAVGSNKVSDNPLTEIKESKIKSFVHNPKGKDNKEAVYTDMNYKTTAVSDKSNKIYTSVSDYPKGPATVKDQPLPSLNAGTLSFYDKLLDKLGAPKTDGNKFILMAWSQIENPSCNWNAFSTKQPYGNSKSCISSGVNKDVQAFTNIDEGVGAAHKTLTNGNYPNLVAALKSGIKTKQDAYNVAVTLQQAPKGDFCVWKEGGIGCKNSNGVPPTTYIAQILSTGKMSGKNIAGSS